MKIKALLLSTVMATALLVGCGSKESTTETPKETPATDAVATASITDDAQVFAKTLGKEGTWIIAATKDITIDEELVLEGEFKNNKDAVQRKIALYTQDESRNVTARFTLTAPKLTIKSPAASIQHGIFKGDLYVETADFQLIDTKVEGNIYFKDEAAKAGFKMDAESSVTGKQEVQQ